MGSFNYHCHFETLNNLFSPHTRQTIAQGSLERNLALCLGVSFKNCLPLSTGTAQEQAPFEGIIIGVRPNQRGYTTIPGAVRTTPKQPRGRGWQLAAISGPSLSLLPLNWKTINHNFRPGKADTSADREWLPQCFDASM